MFSDTELEIAATAYLRARGWDDETIDRHSDTKADVKDRLKAAVDAVAKMRGEA
jgi:acetyl-CoA carboxylase carboxyltransferase component